MFSSPVNIHINMCVRLNAVVNTFTHFPSLVTNLVCILVFSYYSVQLGVRSATETMFNAHY